MKTPKRQLETTKLWKEANPEKERIINKASHDRRKLADPEKYKNAQKLSRDKFAINHPDIKNYRRSIKLMSKYGLTLEEYTAMYNSQNGLCAICKHPETQMVNGRIKNLSVDHNHITGKVRQLLCVNCNRAIGLLKEDILILESALEYLKNWIGSNNGVNNT